MSIKQIYSHVCIDRLNVIFVLVLFVLFFFLVHVLRILLKALVSEDMQANIPGIKTKCRTIYVYVFKPLLCDLLNAALIIPIVLYVSDCDAQSTQGCQTQTCKFLMECSFAYV